MSQAEYTSWLLLCAQELDWLKRLSHMNIRLLARAQSMGYAEIISLLETYSVAGDALEKCTHTREEWGARDLAPKIPEVNALIERRRHRVWRQQERVSPMLERILAECPQKAPRLTLDASGKFHHG